MELRGYQAETIKDLRQCFMTTKPPRRVIVQMPTGSGKTGVLMSVAKHWKRGKVLWMTHRTELADQAYRQAELWGVERDKIDVWTPVRLYNRIKKAQEYGGCPWEKLNVDEMSLLIVDEAHHSTAKTWATVISNFPGDVIGTTATVYRLSKKEGFDHLYNNIVEGPNMKHLTEMKFLCPVRAWHVPERTGEIAGAGNNMGDYSPSQTEANVSARANEYAVAWCLDMCEEHDIPKRIIAFCLTVKHAERVSRVFENLGCRAGIVHAGSKPKERKATVDAFGRGDLHVLCNVNICTEGFDVPDARCVLMLRPTKSKGLYLQMVGRCTRPAEGKAFAMVLDATSNISEFGLPEECDEMTNWMLEARGTAGEGGQAPVVECFKCHSMVHAGCVWCPECGAELRIECSGCGRRKPQKELTEGQCAECRGDWSSDFQNAKEVIGLNLRWYQSRAGNITTTYNTDKRNYRIVVMPSRYDAKYGWMIFNEMSDKPVKMSWRCKNQDTAKERSMLSLRDIVRQDMALDKHDKTHVKASTEDYDGNNQFHLAVPHTLERGGEDR